MEHGRQPQVAQLEVVQDNEGTLPMSSLLAARHTRKEGDRTGTGRGTQRMNLQMKSSF
jgi:hypothetical protein